MKQEEILQYNKRCAMFLGYKILSKPYKGAVTVQEGCYNPMFLHDRIEGESWYVYPEFHSDWNWIMEMVEAIEKLKFNVRITIACITIENAFDNDSNLSPIYKFHSMQGEFESKKEAVVQAINQFLIWYEQNK